MVPFEAQKSSSEHGIIYSSVFNSLLDKLSLDSVPSPSNRNVHIKTSVPLQKPIFETRTKQNIPTWSIRMNIITFL